jgi:hypothetical protein
MLIMSLILVKIYNAMITAALSAKNSLLLCATNMNCKSLNSHITNNKYFSLILSNIYFLKFEGTHFN